MPYDVFPNIDGPRGFSFRNHFVNIATLLTINLISRMMKFQETFKNIFSITASPLIPVYGMELHKKLVVIGAQGRLSSMR